MSTTQSNPNNVDTLAKLCKLDFAGVEKTKISQEFNNILDFVSVIQQADPDHQRIADQDKNQWTNFTTKNNVVREDQVKSAIPREITEKLAPKFASGHIVVPAVINS